MCEPVAAKLNELMVKKGLKPQYKIVENECKSGKHVNTFVMRVSCPIEPNGPIYTAEGWGKSKKEAKHQAAFAFMQKHNLANQDYNQTSCVVSKNAKSQMTCKVNISNKHINAALQTLCTKYNLGSPEYQEGIGTGPAYSKYFTIHCRVLDLSTEGVGITRSEAHLQATTKMIQVLMQEAEVYEIFESPQATINSKNDNKIICLSDNLKVSQRHGPIGIFGRMNRSIEPINETTTTSRKSSKARRNSNMLSIVSDNGNDVALDMNQLNFENNCQQSIGALQKSKSKSLNNLSDLSEMGRNSIQIQTINQIESTLENIETQLYNQILETWQQGDIPRERNVSIQSYDLKVFINKGSPPKIFDGEEKCTDSSIRITAMTKLLSNIKDHVKKNCKIFTDM